MKRFALYLTKEQFDFLKNFDSLSVAEHIRRAVDFYIELKRPVEVSPSLSHHVDKRSIRLLRPQSSGHWLGNRPLSMWTIRRRANLRLYAGG